MKASVSRGVSARKLARLDALLAEEGLAPEPAGIARRPPGEAPPLSVGEEQLWFLAQLAPENPAYNMPFVLRLRGALDPAALRAGLAALCARHEVLRTVYPDVQGQPMKAEIASPPALPLVDLRGLSLAAAEREAARLAAEEGIRPFDLARGPLVRALLLAMAPAEHRLLLNLHHILADGGSMAVLCRELPALHRGSTLPEPPLQHGDFAHWQRGWLASGEAAELRAWWRERLSDLAPQELPADRPASTVPSSRGAFVPVAVGAGSTAALRRLGQGEGATLFMVLLAAFQTLLHRRSGQDDVAVGSPVSGRGRPELQDLVGFLVNMVVLRTDLGGDPTFRELLGRARETALGAFAHGELPFETLVEELCPERRLSRNPLFRAAFVLQQPAAALVEEGGLAWELSEVPTGTAKFDLELELREEPGGLAGRLWYACDLFDAPTAERMAGHLGELLAGIAEDPDRRLSDLPLLTAAEQRQLAEWAGTRTAWPRERGIHELFAEQAARTPQAAALVFGGERISYRELGERADRIARRLAALGIGAESRVGLFAERSPEMVAGTLGILKAGAAYVPLDVQYPRERLEWMLEDADLSAVLTQGHLAGRLPASAPLLLLDGSLGEEAAAEPGPWAGPDSAAYLMYTSGSTGRPKGVVVTHRNVVRLVKETDFARFGESEVFLQLAPISFDAATLEIWGPLLNGGTLVVCDPHTLSLDELGQVIERERVTTLWLTAGLFHQVVDERLASLAGVRQLLAGGDVLSPAHVSRALAGLPGCRLINGYGPTENTTFTCCHTIEEVAADAIPIGRPIANTRVHVLDRSLRPVPVGVPGELCAGGDGLARGYFRRPGVTAGRFVPDPLSAEPGARLYRTGDLVRRHPDGVIDFLGRIDDQVKIRGFRVEPGEVEQALGLHSEVASCAVVVREDRPGDRRLVAYVVPVEGELPGDLRPFLERALPAPMVPSAFVRLNALPLTPNGKVDRRALPAPEDREETRDFVAPRNPLEDVLAGIWSTVLGVERVDARDDFFALGGHSLKIMQVASRIRDAFRVELPLSALFEASTLESLAERVAQEQGAASLPPVRRYPREGVLPLSFAQSRLWFLDQLEPGQATYNIPLALDLHGPLDMPALERSLLTLTARHESLRTTFPWVDGRAVQDIGVPPLEELAWTDLSGLPEPGRDAAAAALESEMARRPFDLTWGPLWRALLVRRSEREHTLVLVLHHTIADGWSLGVLFRDLGAAYAGAALTELPVQYADFALWQREWLQGEALERQLAYWRPRLEGLPALELATDHPRPAVPSRRGAEISRAVDPELLASLRAFSGRRGATLFMTLLASLQALLYRYTGQRDFAIGSAVANRGASELEGLIGFFANTLVLRGSVSGNLPFRDLLAAAHDTSLGAYEHQDAPFELLVETLQPERDLHHAPLFQVLMNLEGEREPLRLEGLDTAVRVLGTGTTKFDLGFSLVEGEEPAVGIEFPVELFEAATIERMLGHWLNLLRGVTESSEAAVESLPLLTPAELRQVAEWAGTRTAYPGERGIHQLFAEQAARTPEATALVFGGERISYRELDRRADRIALRLAALGIGAESRVGLYAERSPEMVAGTLGILKAGAAYVPLDIQYPRERVEWMLADAALSAVLTQGRLAGRLPAGAPLLLLDGNDAGAETAEASAPWAGPDSAAYLIYTSGSTGRPKGVVVTHRNVVRLVRETDFARFGESEVFLQFAPISFDAATLEIWGPLLNGGTLVVCDPHALSLDELGRVIEGERVTTLWLTAGLFHQMVDERLASLAGVHQLLAGGDVLSPAHVRRALAALPGCRLINGYGPTENTTFTCCHTIGEAAAEAIPIGRPIANTWVHVLDRDLRPVPAGVPGELCAGGDGLARGYFNRPGITAERFVPDPLSAEPGARLYRTGDLVRRRPDGVIEFLRRIDNQVKIRGFRIEPEEIETALREHPAVRQSAVAVHRRGGDPALVAYVVPSDGAPLATATLRLFLQERLPHYMVPEVYIALGELPLSPNGKVDRKALPAPGAPEPSGEVGEPRTPVEEILAAIWAEVLGLDRVGVRDDFFELGGHSLKATQVVSRIRAGFQVDLPLRLLFEAPVLADLAARIESLLRETSDIPVPVPADRGRPLPLSFPQQRLWFLDRLEPANPTYNVPALVLWEGDLDGAALEWSLRAMLARHESLRTTFDSIDGDPVQVIGPVPDFQLLVADLCGLPAGCRAAEMKERATRLGQEPFDLGRGPLVRFLLFRLDDRTHGLLTVFHHIVADWWSLGVFLRELGELYQGREAGPLPLQYADFASWQREWLQGERLEAQLAFWRERLGGVPPLDLPTDRPRPAVRSFRGESRPFVLRAGLPGQVESVARAEGVTRFMVYVAVFEALLQRYSGQTDFAVGTPIANRNQPWTEGLIGFFVNTLVLRSDLAGSPSFRELLRRVRDTALGAYAHQDMPFERLVDELAPQRDLSHPPLFQVFLTFQNEVPRRDLPGASLHVEGLPLGRAKFDLTLALGERPEGVEGYLEHNADLFGPATAERLVAHFQRLLEAALAEPDRAVEEQPLLGEAERRQVLVEWNDARGPEPAACVHERFAAHAALHPADSALVCEEVRWTYGELEAGANRLARHLRALGVGPESRVGLCLERSADAILALLATLKAGGAYVPLDPSYPRERLAALLRDAGIAAVVTMERFLPRLPDTAAVCLDRDAAAIAAHPAGAPAGDAGLDRMAYVLFTSGSTGRPKGVVIGHRQLAGYVDGVLARLGLPDGSSYATVSTLSADLGNTAVFPALCTGGCLHVISERRATDPILLAEYFRRERVDCLKIVPSHLAALQSGPDPAGVLPVRRLVLGGEASSWERVEELRALAPELGILNHYGPTETTVGVLTWTVGERVEGAPAVPLGRPLPNVRVYVLDRRLDPLPAGVPGELCVGGGSLARGYLGQPDLTAARFVPDPFAERPGSRLYRTGDRARLLPDGCVEFLGRIDHQVKIRGFRVEPGEIEAALERCAGVRDAVVMARDGADGSRELAAWVVGERSLDAAGLREALRSELPPHMIPAAFVFLDALPLNANGKVDREALPAPERPRVDRMAGEAPEDGLQRRITDLWKEVLGVERVGLHDNFFDLGGHSLLLVRVQGRMRRDLGLEVPVVDLFRFPTVSALAAHLGGGAAATPAPVRAAVASGDVAVIGLSGRFPGARSAEELWDNLCRGVESITFFGAPSAGEAPGQRHVPARGVLADADLFDAGFFGIRPREAELLDPQHRLFLECSWEALEGAGYDPARYPGAIGVWAGAGRSWYYLSQIHGGPAMEDPESHFGNDKDFLPTRVSYKLGLRGPSLAVQTSCSSSLVAVHLACRSLAAGECDMALAGGARVVVPQDRGYVYEEGGIASPDGHCRAFDAEARGVVPGNGVGVVLLKRLQDALADGDTVLAVVKGSAINNDGWDKVGYTAPSVEGQARAIAAAHAAAGVAAASISYVEAHGTGTALGDPIEVAALKQAFAGVEGKGSCALGSIKTNLGHLDAAAGVAGLMKLVLSLQNGLLPPSLHFTRPNPDLGLEESPFYVVDSLRPWAAAGPRRGGVSSFGIGGTNAHVVVEEPPATEPSGPSRPWQLLTVSARTETALQRAASNLADHLESHPDVSLSDAAYTLHAGRRAFPRRRAVVCRDLAEAAASLRAGEGAVAAGSSVAFLFPGQGAQRVRMAQDLYGSEPVFRAEIDRAAEILREPLGLDLRELLFPAEGREEEAARRLERTELTQPALFAVEHALARLWMFWGIRPAAMLGHSVGEYVAACLAGVFSLEDALALVAERGRLMGEMPPGAMLAVPLPEAELRARLAPGLSLAAVNAASACVVAGEPEAVAALRELLLAEGTEARPLRVSHAFHSEMMDPVLDRFAAAVARVERRAPSLPWVSNVSGTWIREDEAVDPAYWARHLRTTVRFADGLVTLMDDPGRVLLEVGPGETLCRFARRTAPGAAVVTSLARQDGEDPGSVLEALGRLWTAGIEPDWTSFHAGERRRRVPLPTYPFERKRYWAGGAEARPPVVSAPAGASVVLLAVPPGGSPAVPAGWTARPLADPLPAELLAAFPEAPQGAAFLLLSPAAPEKPPEEPAEPPAAVEDAPRDEIESAIAGIWQEAFGIAHIGVHDGFFQLGGDSLLATQIVARMRAALGREVTLSAFLEAQTIARLSDLCRKTSAVPQAGLGELLAGLERLSTEELEALLAARTSDNEISDRGLS